jgi:iron(III) transport system permease protein
MSMTVTSRASTSLLERWGLLAVLMAIVGFLILLPIFMLLLGSFSKYGPLQDEFSVLNLSFASYQRAFSDPNLLPAIQNSFLICFNGTIVALVLGASLALVAVRTDVPFRRSVGTIALLPLFLPPLVAAIAWSLLASPKAGLLNVLLHSVGLGFVIDFYSLTGMTLVLGIYYAPYIYMFIAAALRNMDPSLEEAALMSGNSNLRAMVTITLPLIAPAILASTLLSFAVMLGIYSIPAVLGTPAKIGVLTTLIYRVVSLEPPLYNVGAAISFVLIVVTLVCLNLQRVVIGRRSFITITGKAFTPRVLRVGAWRYPILLLIVLYAIVSIVLPLGALTVAAFRKFMFIPNLGALFDLHAYSLSHFHRLWEEESTLRSLRNTLGVSGITAVAGGALAFVIAYALERTRMPGRSLLDACVTLPAAVPGIVLGVGYIWAWIGLPGGLWGSFMILPLAYVARFLPDAVKSMSTSLRHIHADLEEASWVSGVARFATIRSVVLPLAGPGLMAAMTLLFVLSVREYGSALFLTNSRTVVASVLLLESYETANVGMTAAFSLIFVAMFVAVTLTARAAAALLFSEGK